MTRREQSTPIATKKDRCREGWPPDTAAIIALAEAALAGLPSEFLAHVRGIGIVVEDIADDETLDAVGCENAYDLSGLYQGVPMTQRSVSDTPHAPDRIVLYRLPILLEWIEDDHSLADLVRHVLIHEIGHHFGFSDDEIDRINAGG